MYVILDGASVKGGDVEHNSLANEPRCMAQRIALTDLFTNSLRRGE